MSAPTPEVDAAEFAMKRWHERNYEANRRGSHLDSDDPKPANGWDIARRLEQQRDALKDALEDIRDYESIEGESFKELAERLHAKALIALSTLKP